MRNGLARSVDLSLAKAVALLGDQSVDLLATERTEEVQEFPSAVCYAAKRIICLKNGQTRGIADNLIESTNKSAAACHYNPSVYQVGGAFRLATV